MSMHKHHGIVLKNYYPQKSSLSLLDPTMGRIMGIAKTVKQISGGALIEYTLDRGKQNPYFIQNIQLRELPLDLAAHDIFFLHHLIEICYHFIPLGSDASNVYRFLQQIYRDNNWMKSRVLKKIFLLQLYTEIGIYPEYALSDKALFHTLIAVPFTRMQEHEYDAHEEHITQWLQTCFYTHQDAATFKTKDYYTV